jgi:NhaA family Na+:H+ antiporter
MLVPAGIYLLFNYGGVAQAGAGIPMATDIAFALGILSLGNRVPLSLKIFLTALAVIDDLERLWLLPYFLHKTILWSNLLRFRNNANFVCPKPHES